MDTDNIVSITTDGKLELPPKIQRQIKPGDRYKVSIREDSIILEKVQPPLDLNDWFRRIEELGLDPNQPSLQEISEMVKEVRREPKFNK
ncbi:hypothetical protein [Dapis sp. BLCC M229]|uniref:hypothetical protein n=1 Tax=Dapis sp. BLCC M229 TaxID=3400188 RepID=UPI003CF163E9